MSELSLRPEELRSAADGLRDHGRAVAVSQATPTVSLPAGSGDLGGAIDRLFASESATAAWAAAEAVQYATVLTQVLGDTLTADRYV